VKLYLRSGNRELGELLNFLTRNLRWRFGSECCTRK
jgi:hypothetical protein